MISFLFRSTPFRHTVAGLALSGFTLAVTGCSGGGSGNGGTGGGGTTPTPNPATHIYATGNWQFDATATTGTAPFASLSGFINEQGTNPGVDDLTTAALQPQSAPCYIGTTTIPLQGSVLSTSVVLRSFLVTGQLLNITATPDATVTHLTGNYTIAGGCADKAAGTLSGTKYAPLNGTYTGIVVGSTPAKTIQLKVSQFLQGSGSGDFLVSGTAVFTGYSCFTKGTLPSTSGSVVGSTAKFTFDTDDANGAQVVLAGSFNPAADTITLTSGSVTSGGCSGPVGVATLSLAK